MTKGSVVDLMMNSSCAFRCGSLHALVTTLPTSSSTRKLLALLLTSVDCKIKDVLMAGVVMVKPPAVPAKPMLTDVPLITATVAIVF